MSKCYDNPEYDKIDDNLQNTWKQSKYVEPKQIYYNTVGRENGKFVIKGQFNTQKEALDLANELNKKFPDLYYDWNETLIKEEPKQEQQKQHLINMMHDDEELGLYEEPKQETKCYCGHTTYCDCGPLEEPKQEIEKL